MSKRDIMQILENKTQIIEDCSQVVLCFDNSFNISFLSKGAELLFDLNREMQQSLADIKVKGMPELNTIANFESYKKGQVTTKDKITKNVVLSISPRFIDGKFAGGTLVAMEYAMITKAVEEQEEMQKKDKKTFLQIRNAILLNLARKKMAINQISLETGINWKTVEKHLTYLLGKKMVCEVFSTEYLRVFEISERGKEELRRIYSDRIFDQEIIK